MRLDLDRDEFMAFNGESFRMSSSRLESETLATRGDRLALARLMFKGADHLVGPTEIESLAVIEADEHGKRLTMIRFDAGDLDAAHAELDLRYAAGEAAPHASCWETMCHFRRAVAAHDWAQLDSVFAPELVFEDHRVMGWGTLRSRDELVARLRALVEHAPDAVLRDDHVLALGARGALSIGRWIGSRDGGGLEIPTVGVRVVASDGRISHFHVYDLEQLDEARARFEALVAERETLSRENAATRTLRRIYGYLETRDWERVTACVAPDFKMFDVRSLVHLELDWAQQLESLRAVASMSSYRLTWEPFATRGERLALARGRFSGADLSSGPSEVEWLSVAEVNGAGAVVATVMFNPDDFEGAYAELDRRQRASAPRPSESLAAHAAPNLATAAMDRAHAAFAARDWAALRGAWAANATFEDRRRHMLLSLDAERWLADVQENVGASPDASIERRLTCTSGERVAIERRISRGGSAGGLQGPYEIETLWLFETDEDGLIVSAVLFDPSDWRAAEREAWARWLANDADAAPVMRPIFELTDAFNDHDRERLRAVLADDVVTHDHRLAGLGRFQGADRLVESLASEWALTPNVQQSSQFQVARGSHGAVGLSRLFGTSPEGGPFDDLLATVAVVAGGRIARLEVFEVANLDWALARFAELR
jgi:ketosteroid isomerase-like protein